MFMCFQLCNVIGGSGHVPYLYTGLVPILEWDTDQHDNISREGEKERVSTHVHVYTYNLSNGQVFSIR